MPGFKVIGNTWDIVLEVLILWGFYLKLGGGARDGENLFITFTGKWAEWCGTGYEEEEEEDCGEGEDIE